MERHRRGPKIASYLRAQRWVNGPPVGHHRHGLREVLELERGYRSFVRLADDDDALALRLVAVAGNAPEERAPDVFLNGLDLRKHVDGAGGEDQRARSDV